MVDGKQLNISDSRSLNFKFKTTFSCTTFRVLMSTFIHHNVANLIAKTFRFVDLLFVTTIRCS